MFFFKEKMYMAASVSYAQYLRKRKTPVPDGERGIGVWNRQGKKIFTIYSLLTLCLNMYLKKKINPRAETTFTAVLFIIAKK